MMPALRDVWYASAANTQIGEDCEDECRETNEHDRAYLEFCSADKGVAVARYHGQPNRNVKMRVEEKPMLPQTIRTVTNGTTNSPIVPWPPLLSACVAGEVMSMCARIDKLCL